MESGGKRLCSGSWLNRIKTRQVIAIAACVMAAGIYTTTNLNVGAIILNNEKEPVFKNSHFIFLFFSVRSEMCQLWQNCPACRLSTWMGQV